MKPSKTISSGCRGQLEVDGMIYSKGQPLMASHVGQIIMSVTLDTAAKVQAIYGGTWTAWGVGRVAVGVNASDTDFATVQKTGGAKTVTLTTSQIPAHRHGQNIGGNGGDGWNNTFGAAITRPENTGSGTSGYSYANAGGNWNGKANRVYTDNTGSGGAHNNLQPYITCYMWRRTA